MATCQQAATFLTVLLLWAGDLPGNGDLLFARGKEMPWQRRTSQREYFTPQSSSALKGAHCLNSVSGKYRVADDRGYVCKRGDLDVHSGCCDTHMAKQNQCDGCHKECCTEFENCISCCLGSKGKGGKGAELYKTKPISRGRDEMGHFKTPFEYCRGRCRTFSKSVVHENAYVNRQHYCYAEVTSRSSRSGT